ncbi:uncharacterized protein LOC115762809 [Drosophila novamexicana]|uniref:uncharacterized protein LOC115762809 n=1 Tax=Drosophila novamexicana TaxID=47314 RepID=UPI0011E5B5EE|nr:uncharacterized protein LOC115762809 [Drosophila novamexicana]
MRNCVWLLLLLILASAKGKPLVSFGLGVQAQRPYTSTYLPGETYYNNYYGIAGPVHHDGAYSRYPSGYPYAQPYPATYSPGQRFGAALDIGIGALSLTPFLL